MFVAVDKEGNRVYASADTDRSIGCFCPVCGGEVRLRAGSVNVAHFAHVSSCTDDFTADMSEWHRAWQELFPKGNREVVITHGEEKHRADVLCYGTVIEFQHSPISASEFRKRNSFYTSAGYRVLWVFDVLELFEGYDSSGRMYVTGDVNTRWGDSGTKFRWKYPFKSLDGFLPQDEKRIDIFFHTGDFGENPKDEEDDCSIEKVTWVNDEFEPLWGVFHSLNKYCFNFYELKEWLKQRWEKENIKTENRAEKPFIKDCTYKYRLNHKENGRVLDITEFNAILEENKPLRRLVSDSFAWKRKPPYPRVEQFCPRDKKVYRNFDSGHCYGCVYCFAIEEVNGDMQYVYCKHPYRVSVDEFPDVYYRVRK